MNTHLRKPHRLSAQKVIVLFCCILFGIFLLLPMGIILYTSLFEDGHVTPEFYSRLFEDGSILRAFGNSVLISAASGVISTVLAFIPAYAIHFTNIPRWLKTSISALMMLPMLLPTITYGFAMMYSLGKQGLITRLLGTQLVDIYGIGGLLIGYIIYTLPVSFMLIHNTMQYIDKRFMTVSRMLGDSRIKSFFSTVITPLIGTLAIAFIQSFTLSFTDYGIPAALAGNVELLSTRLYQEMLGSLPDFNTGSAVSILMLLPSVLSILLVSLLNKHSIRYRKISTVELRKNRARDLVFGLLSAGILLGILSVFAVMFIVPFVEQWPYRMSVSAEHICAIFSDSSLMRVYINSLLVALVSALFGTLLVYATALVAARPSKDRKYGKLPDIMALITNTIPGMVLGVAYLLCFKGTDIHNTFAILVICNIVHFFSSPYLMMKSSLEKLNADWETTARLMGDSWLKTVVRIITPNVLSSIFEVFSYFFVNAMVTVSAVIFLVGTKTMVITAKIKELQHFANFNEIFVLSILILITNLAVKGLVRLFAAIQSKKGTSK